MLCRRIIPFAAVLFVWQPTFAQPVISARAGLIQTTVGSVFLDDERLESMAGKFDQIDSL